MCRGLGQSVMLFHYHKECMLERNRFLVEHAQAIGESATTFINRAIDNQISNDRKMEGTQRVDEKLLLSIMSGTKVCR